MKMHDTRRIESTSTVLSCADPCNSTALIFHSWLIWWTLLSTLESVSFNGGKRKRECCCWISRYSTDGHQFVDMHVFNVEKSRCWNWTFGKCVRYPLERFNFVKNVVIVSYSLNRLPTSSNSGTNHNSSGMTQFNHDHAGSSKLYGYAKWIFCLSLCFECLSLWRWIRKKIHQNFRSSILLFFGDKKKRYRNTLCGLNPLIQSTI